MSRKRMPAHVVREVHARSEGVCEAMIPGVCGWRGEHLHHRKLRSQGGEHTTENTLDICARCHDYVHRHTGWSYEQGLLVKGAAEVTWPPVYYRGRRKDDGTHEYDQWGALEGDQE